MINSKLLRRCDDMAIWNPWRGCKKCSEGCLYRYIHKGDFKKNVNTNEIIKTKDFKKSIEKSKDTLKFTIKYVKLTYDM